MLGFKDAFVKICWFLFIDDAFLILLISIIDHEEGFHALFKGDPTCVIQSSPQFGFTLGEHGLDFY